MTSPKYRAHRYFFALSTLFIVLPCAPVAAQSVRAPYLRRGDDVELHYKLHQQQLEELFRSLSTQVERDAPDLRQKMDPPTPVPFGYQILPNLLTDPTPQSQPARVALSPFSWPRTDSIINRGNERLAALQQKLDSTSRMPVADRRPAYEVLVSDYRKLVDGQKFMESLIQYNRFWQSEITRFTDAYKQKNSLRDAALGRQALLDSMSRGDEQFRQSAKPRAEAFSRMLDSALQKAPTPEFVRVEHPTQHTWIVSVPVYTDIMDSTFVSRAQETIENGWHVHDGDDDFSVKLDLRRISPSTLYANDVVPANGTHIDVAAHVKRFPKDGVVLTTGSNTTYVLGQNIILGPHAILRKTLVHEFGHMLGFKDGYFRSYYDFGDNGFNIVEVVLDQNDIVATPESGKASRKHFEQILKDKVK